MQEREHADGRDATNKRRDALFKHSKQRSPFKSTVFDYDRELELLEATNLLIRCHLIGCSLVNFQLEVP